VQAGWVGARVGSEGRGNGRRRCWRQLGLRLLQRVAFSDPTGHGHPHPAGSPPDAAVEQRAVEVAHQRADVPLESRGGRGTGEGGGEGRRAAGVRAKSWAARAWGPPSPAPAAPPPPRPPPPPPRPPVRVGLGAPLQLCEVRLEVGVPQRGVALGCEGVSMMVGPRMQQQHASPGPPPTGPSSPSTPTPRPLYARTSLPE
jgi:hypothetical protein